jgi:hypothetical protein
LRFDRLFRAGAPMPRRTAMNAEAASNRLYGERHDGFGYATKAMR